MYWLLTFPDSTTIRRWGWGAETNFDFFQAPWQT